MDKVDNTIPLLIRHFLVNITAVGSTLFVISYSLPIFIAAVIPLGIVFLIFQVEYDIFPSSPTKLWKSNVFSCVCPSLNPWGSNVTITYDALDFITQGPTHTHTRTHPPTHEILLYRYPQPLAPTPSSSNISIMKHVRLPSGRFASSLSQDNMLFFLYFSKRKKFCYENILPPEGVHNIGEADEANRFHTAIPDLLEL